MDRVEIGTSGELTLSQQMLEHLGVTPGEQVKLFMLPGGMVRIRKVVASRDQASPRTIISPRPGGNEAR